MKKSFIPTQAFEKMLEISPMGAVIWEIQNSQWHVRYFNEKASQFLPFESLECMGKVAEPFLENLGKVDLISIFNQVLKLQKTQEAIIRHHIFCDRAQVFLTPLSSKALVSYYINVNPSIRMENELQSMIHELNQGNTYMSGRESEVLDLEEQVNSLQLKILKIKKSLTF